MRLAQLEDRLCRTSPIRLRRRAGRTLLPALLWALAPGCATAPVPPPSPVVTASPPSEPVAPPVVSAPVAEPVSALPPIEIHQADLHGQFESRQGATISIHALLMMTKTKPEVGNKGVLYCAPAGAQGDADWVPLGEVEVKKPLDGDGNLQVKIIDDEKKFVIPGGKKPSPLVRKTRLKLRWQW